jgi:hypothetical protein
MPFVGSKNNARRGKEERKGRAKCPGVPVGFVESGVLVVVRVGECLGFYG